MHLSRQRQGIGRIGGYGSGEDDVDAGLCVREGVAPLQAADHPGERLGEAERGRREGGRGAGVIMPL